MHGFLLQLLASSDLGLSYSKVERPNLPIVEYEFQLGPVRGVDILLAQILCQCATILFLVCLLPYRKLRRRVRSHIKQILILP